MRTALTEVGTAFGLLTCEPAPLALDVRGIDGLPQRSLPLGSLRELLVAGIGADASDEVWRRLIRRTRDGDPAWTVGAVGVALPGLTGIAVRLARRAPALTADIDSEVLSGFLTALRDDPLSRPRIWLRMTWAAWRAGLTARAVEEHVELPAEVPVGSRTPDMPYGHPDLLLDRAVVAGILTRPQADLIGATRLEHVLVEQLAAEAGVGEAAIRKRRRLAERLLTEAILDGVLTLPARRAPGRLAVVSGCEPVSAAGRVRAG